MKQRLTLLLLILSLLLMGGQSTSPIQRASLQRELQDLRQQGLTYRVLDNNTIEISQEWSGLKRVKTLQEPSEASIRAWAATRNVPILEINPATLDTTRWSGWYRYWTTLPLSNGFGFPLIVGDMNVNGNPEVYGIYKDYLSDFESHIYEVDSAGRYTLLYNYVPRLGPSVQFTNVNRDSLTEIMFAQQGGQYFYSQATAYSLPIQFSFHFQRDSSSTSGGFQPAFGLLDGDTITDMVYIGTTNDSSGQPTSHLDVAEFNSQQNNFVRVWYSRFSQNRFVNFGNPTFGDYDRDGLVEIEACEMNGKIFVAENRGNNAYIPTWRDSTRFVNLYYQISGDIDQDRKPEFYAGATMGNGNWTIMYEADSNDHYSPRFIFHLLSGGSLDEPTYLTPDVDHDGRNELAILSGADLYVFKSNANDSFYLWYYKRFTAKESIQFYDFNHDGKDDFILSRSRVDSIGRGAHFADIYLAQRFTGVNSNDNDLPKEFSLTQNFPNPFNPTTTIRFHLPNNGFVTLKVYDLLGREVGTLVNEERVAGAYDEVFDASKLASGVYIYKLQSGNFKASKKLLILK